MEDTTFWSEIFGIWFPVFILIWGWIFFTRQSNSKRINLQTDYMQKLEGLMLKQNGILEEQTKVLGRIVDALENRSKPNNSN
jgi:hypothetical protein